MLISCSICKDIFYPSCDVCTTPCGHLYHELCLKKWQERSESCPQCRTKLKKKPHRIYFVIEDNIESEAGLDGAALREKLHTLREDLADAKRINQQLEASNADIQQELVAYAEKAAAYDLTVKALKQRVKELNNENEELRPLLKANESLKLELKNMANLKILLEGTENEVCEMINRTPVTPLAVHQLCVYVEALKKQLKISEEKFKVENERLVLNCKLATKKVRELIKQVDSKMVQTSCKKHKETENTVGLKSKKHFSKRTVIDSHESVAKCENKHEFSKLDADCQPPVAKKHCSLIQKKVINNLEKTTKREPSSDVEFLIYPGPNKNRVLKSLVAQEGSGIFKKIMSSEQSSNHAGN